MALRRIELPWYEQPWEAAELSDLGQFVFGRGFLANLTERGKIGPRTFSDAIARSPGTAGVGMLLNSSVNQATTFVPANTATWINGASAVTSIALFQPASVPTGTNEERLFARWGNNSANDQFIVTMRGPEFGLLVRNGPLEGRQTSGLSLTPGRVYCAIGIWNSALSGRHRFFVDGRQIATAADGAWFVNGSTSTVNSSTVSNMFFGTQADGAAKPTSTILYLAGIAPGDCGDAIAQQISLDPWQLFADRQIWVPSSAPAPSALPTLSAPTAIDITATSMRPRVTYAY